MIETLAIFCLVIWMLGLVSDFTLGGGIHLFLAGAVILFAIRLFRRRDSPRSRPPS